MALLESWQKGAGSLDFSGCTEYPYGVPDCYRRSSVYTVKFGASCKVTWHVRELARTVCSRDEAEMGGLGGFKVLKLPFGADGTC